MTDPWYTPRNIPMSTRAISETLNTELAKIKSAFDQIQAIGDGSGPNYTWLAWADSADGTVNFSTASAGTRAYIGISANRSIVTPSPYPEDYRWSLIKGTGTNAPPVILQYSVDGATAWHSPYVAGDKYWRQSVDGGVSFTPSARLSAATLAELDAAASAALAAAGANIVTLQSQMAANSAAITSEASTRASADAASASLITTLQTTLAGQTTTVTAHTSSINGIQGKYGVTIDAGGKITGIELIGGGGASSFTVKADQFAIETAGQKPFEVIGGVTYIKQANIKDLSINSQKIDTFAVRKTYFNELATNVTIPNASTRARVASVTITKDDATSAVEARFFMRPRPGHDWAGQFVVGANSGAGDVDLDTVWAWLASVVISGTRSSRFPISYFKRFTGLSAGSHTFYVDLISFNTPSGGGFIEAGSSIQIEEIKR